MAIKKTKSSEQKELAPFKNAKGIYKGFPPEMLKVFDEAVSVAFHMDPAYVGFRESFTVDELFPIFQKGVEFGKQLALNASKELKQGKIEQPKTSLKKKSGVKM